MSNTHEKNTQTAAGWPELAEGQRDWRVAVVSFLLHHLGYYGREEVGDEFHCGLVEVVVAYQRARDLERNGRVDAATWKQLTRDLGVVRQGDGGTRVKAVQEALISGHGHDLVLDGVFGPATLAAVRAFQKGAGIAIDGEVGPITFEELIVPDA
ncbi:peptidoglycan-binding domain-containing protein [Nocardiopsis deserti]|uniref:peptidoglycan-binding domain-containing protein n=1 Tax=Nocardiopsis deserti TaxID=2605988 RepID=UPI00123A1D6C|nr:peptidoglycan-binding protein [Nocardiopsis deserti]